MSVSTREATLIKQAKHQVEYGEYDGAWATYRDFRASLDEEDCDARTLQVLDEAERAANASFRTGAVGFESEMHTLLFLAQRVIADSETGPYRC